MCWISTPITHDSVPGAPNLSLHSDPACIAFRSLSTSRYLGFVQRLGAGGAGELHSLGVNAGFASTGSISKSRFGSLVAPQEFVPPRLVLSPRNPQRGYVTPPRHGRRVPAPSAAFPFSSSNSGATLRTFGNSISFFALSPLSQRFKSRLTLRCTRTPPALPSALFHLPASSASFSASVQAVPVSFIR
jgi:hypothetical protein